jgi:hypothetical protein
LGSKRLAVYPISRKAAAMEQLSIWNEDVGRLVLFGPGMAAPFSGADFRPNGGPGQSVREAIDLLLEDTSPATLSAGLSDLERLLQAAASEADLPPKPVYLECSPAPGEDLWQSRILSGWIEPLGGERAFGSLGVRLHLERENAWQGSEACLPISNRSGARMTSGLTLYNHCDADAGHDNFAEIAPADLPGDLPGPARFEIHNLGGSVISYLALYQDAHQTGGLFFATMLEAENASAGTNLDDPTCSGGKLRQFNWSGPDPSPLCAWYLPDQAASLADGRTFKPIARLAGRLGSDEVWLRLTVKMDADLLWAGAWNLAPTGQELVELNSLRLPPALAGMGRLAGVYLGLEARCATPANHSLLLDYLALTPADGWRRLTAHSRGAPTLSSLVDDGITGQVYTASAGVSASGFSAYGDPIQLLPGCAQRIGLLAMDASGLAAPERSFSLKIFYRPRRRRL